MPSKQSGQKLQIVIQICSNCNQHQWCTRHVQNKYVFIAKQLQATLLSQNSQLDIITQKVGGSKMGAFQIYCNGTLIFSKLKFGYFPHTQAVTTRILSFVDNFKSGEDIRHYDVNYDKDAQSYSPVKPRPQSGNHNSPTRKPMTTSNQKRKTPQVQNDDYSHQNQLPKRIELKKVSPKKQQVKKEQPKKQHKKQQHKKALQTPKKQQSHKKLKQQSHHKQSQKNPKKISWLHRLS